MTTRAKLGNEHQAGGGFMMYADYGGTWENRLLSNNYKLSTHNRGPTLVVDLRMPTTQHTEKGVSSLIVRGYCTSV